MATVTIHNLEVRLDVEGKGDEAVFTDLFQKHIRAWSRQMEEKKTMLRMAANQRSLGDRGAGEDE